MGLQFGYLLGGSILMDAFFNRPGCGHLPNLYIEKARGRSELRACFMAR